MYVASSAAQGAVGLPQMLAAPAGGVMTGQQLLGALQQQQMQQQQQQQQQQQVPAAVAAAAVSPDVPADWAAGRKNHGVEQGQLGVRVAEFHELSPFAVFVHPSSALKLQSLWDSGNELVSCGSPCVAEASVHYISPAQVPNRCRCCHVLCPIPLLHCTPPTLYDTITPVLPPPPPPQASILDDKV
jgi:hypothetical protein